MMEVRLMHPERDFVPPDEVPRQVHFRDPDAGPRHEPAACEKELWADLELDTLAGAMAGGDAYVFDVARKALLLGPRNDAATILYRQAILRDCLANAGVVRSIYTLVEETVEEKKKYYFGVLTRYPAGILRGAVELMQMLMSRLRRLRGIADAQADRFDSPGMSALFAMLRREFGEDYLNEIEQHLAELRFRGGLL
ncbi:MAG: DNA mismatch repair protein MutS, partial [Proteobacteria bacterium]|nr:DNA mismatch repair protein MutS [Pseudomonadota bacterium]